MIVFLEDPALLGAIAAKNPNQSQWKPGLMVICNFSSLYSGYADATAFLTKAAPMNNTGLPLPEFVQTVGFDVQFASAVFNDPELFNLFMYIITQSFNGAQVILLIQRDSYRDLFMESFIKLVQQRYGYNCWIVSGIEDVELLKEQQLKPNGVIAFDQDNIRYQEMNNFKYQIPEWSEAMV